jgi:hypothetical protein
MNYSINLDSCIVFILSISAYSVQGLFYYIIMLILYSKVIFFDVDIKLKGGFTC